MYCIQHDWRILVPVPQRLPVPQRRHQLYDDDADARPTVTHLPTESGSDIDPDAKTDTSGDAPGPAAADPDKNVTPGPTDGTAVRI